MKSIRHLVFNRRTSAATLCIIVGILLSLESSGIRNEIRNSQISGLKELLAVPMAVSNQLDGKMYILLTEGIRATVFNSDKSNSAIRLSRFDIQINSAETKDLIYLAHTDRFRIVYPLLNIIFAVFFGSYSFLVINLLSLFALLNVLFRYLGSVTLNGIIMAVMLMASTVPVYSLFYMPEAFLYTVVSIYFVVLYQEYVDESNRFLDKRTSRSIILLFPLIACLTKPMFILILPALIYVLFKLRQRTPLDIFFNIICMIMAAIMWLFWKSNNATPLEVLNHEFPLKNIYSASGLVNSTPQESFNYGLGNLHIPRYPHLILSELNAQITKNNNSTIVLLLVILIIFWYFKAKKESAFLAAIFIGALITQGQGQGFGTNLRFMNYVLIVGVFLAAKAWVSPHTPKNEMISDNKNVG